MSAPDAAAAGAVAPRARRLTRFSRAERITHWVNAVLWGVCIGTGLMFRFGVGQSILTDRLLWRNVHVIAGLGIVAAFLVGIMGRWGAALRRDLSRFNRWSRDDVRWLRTFGTDATVRLGKFNPGQKLNATFIGASALVLAATGSIMKWNKPFSTDLRTGADFVHGWFALFVGIAVLGHVVMAFRDREALGGMIGGTVSANWARRHRPAWFREARADDAPAGGDAPTSGGSLPVDA
jgi:formate dehydrogenase subunit gamma